MFNDKVILITGATGSFGRVFIRHLLDKYQPKKVIVYSRDEYKQYEMCQDFPEPTMRFFIGDVRDGERLKMAMKHVDYVVHAAALKQVPAAEYNPMECIKTNIHGAENVISAAIYNNVEKVIALSTDKAVSPVNLYGATKLASDKLFVAANNMVGKGRTRFSVVRYGNVVGSRGSVLPYFKKLLDSGITELPITDYRMTRFWITLAQGILFVSNCFYRMHGGEVFVPKIPTVRIVDLAKSLGENVTTKEIGIRPGEKLHESMCPSEDSIRTIEFLDHYVITPTINIIPQVEYTKNSLGDVGGYVKEGFEYDSLTNADYLSIEQLNSMYNNLVLV